MDMIFINPHKCCTFVTEKSCLTSNANLCIIQKLKLLPSHYLYWGETLVNRSFLAIRHILAEFYIIIINLFGLYCKNLYFCTRKMMVGHDKWLPHFSFIVSYYFKSYVNINSFKFIIWKSYEEIICYGSYGAVFSRCFRTAGCRYNNSPA